MLMQTKAANVDLLGTLQAQIAELEAQAEALKTELKQEEGHIEGNLYKACVTLSQRKTVDNKAVYAEANVPAELIEKHTKTTAVITIKVTAR